MFGHELEIETMPFKEQDGIVASCATTALWMAFQKTSELFNTKAPSLSEVTLLAGDKSSNSGKIFPSKGLEVYQVCKAINNNGLISELRTDLANERYFKGYIYSYLKGNVPVLLGLRFSSNEEHLVTINGYRFVQPSNEIKYVSDRIERLYVHDDQIGPFTRLLINSNQNITIKENEEEINYDYDLTTSWWKKEKLHEWINKNDFSTKAPTFVKDDFENATTAYVITPLAPVIKITYDDIFEQQEIISFVTNSFMNLGKSIVWDIFMIKSNEYKKWLIEKYKLQNNKQLKSIITQSLPQYIWIVQAWIGDVLFFDYIYDTIELNKSGQPVAINVYEEKLLKDLQKSEKIDNLCSSGFFVHKYRNSLIRTINESPYDLKEVKQWLSMIFDNDEEWDVTKLKLEQLWNLEDELLNLPKLDKDLSFPDALEEQFLKRKQNKNNE